MSNQIKQRTGTASSWTSTNPTLSQGEIANEYDTGKFKIGTGSTAWNSLAYAGATGPAQTKPYRSLGDGSDGNVTISSGTTTLTTDAYYNNLTISGTGKLVTSGYRVFVKGILDLTAAPAGAINATGTNGGDASGVTGGTTTAPPATGSLGVGGAGTVGVTATTGVGGQATAAGAVTGSNGGISGAGGAGGTGTNAGGASRAGTTPTLSIDTNKWETAMIRGVTLLSGGAGGPGGSAGGGDGTNNGGGGGGGATGGNILALYANIILKSASTAANCINANGGNGGKGGDGAGAGVTGGGGGGGGGAGGWIYIAYNALAGATAMNMIAASGGNGGTGGSGFGTAALGGQGGAGGYGGRITLVCITNPSSGLDYYAPGNVLYNPQVTTGINAFLTSGGQGGFPGLLLASL